MYDAKIHCNYDIFLHNILELAGPLALGVLDHSNQFSSIIVLLPYRAKGWYVVAKLWLSCGFPVA